MNKQDTPRMKSILNTLALASVSTSRAQHSKMQSLRIERSYDKQGNETEMVAMKTGSDTSGIIMNKWLINQIDIKCWH